MNSFPRNSRYLDHMISALNRRYVCSECGANLVWACGFDTETLTCINNQLHTGLLDNKDQLARDRVERDSTLRRVVEVVSNASVLGDEFVLLIESRTRRALVSLWGVE